MATIAAMPPSKHKTDTVLTTLPNGMRVATVQMPWRETASLSVFVRTGSQHESRRQNGISHVVEHMAFKGTLTRDCQQINLDAERLGAEVNAHTDKDHTAFHIEGLASDLGAFVPMLADIVQCSTFPEAELERERQVILHEFTEFEEDPMSAAFTLFDRVLYGEHALGRPVIGTRGNVRRFSCQELMDYVRSQYTAANVVVAAAGNFDAQRFVRDVEAAFGAMPAGTENRVSEPAALGGVKTHRMVGSTQCQLVMGYGTPALRGEHLPHVLAAALLGEGMSSPLLDEIRERRGLAYYAGCSADVSPLAGQFVIEAATAPEQAEELLVEVMRLLRAQAESVDAVGLERARKQLIVRALRAREQPARRLELAAQEIFTFGKPQPPEQAVERLRAVTAAQVRDALAGMLAHPPAVALAGRVPRRATERVAELVAGAAS